jgi:hypothetical protein
MARLHVGDYSRRAANICNAISSMRFTQTVIKSTAVRGACNALGENEILVGFVGARFATPQTETSTVKYSP